MMILGRRLASSLRLEDFKDFNLLDLNQLIQVTNDLGLNRETLDGLSDNGMSDSDIQILREIWNIL